jgi:uncharacterized protein RhaS with RHS repeats
MATVSYAYDRLGRRVAASDANLGASFTYNNAGQILLENYTSGQLNGLALTNVFDTLGRRSSMALKQGATTLAQTAYAYDGASRLLRVTNGLNVVSYSYLANSSLIGQIIFTTNGSTRMTTTRQYDKLNRLSAGTVWKNEV